MNVMDLPHRSSWRAAPQPPERPALSHDAQFDAVIIGGGLTGVIAAHLLKDSGLRIALLERGRLGDWATGSTTAMLMELLDTEAHKLVERFGLESARAMTQAHRGAISLIERIAADKHIECEFMRCPAYVYANDTEGAQELKEQLKGMEEVGTVASFAEGPIGFKNEGAIKVENQAKFHPLKFVFGLSKSIDGVEIYENTEVASIDEEKDVTLKLKSGHRVKAKKVFMATHYPLDPQPAKLRFKKAWYLTYVLEALVPKGALPTAMFEDTALPYHYARIDAHDETRDRLIIGGEDRRMDMKTPDEECWARLEAYLKEAVSAPYELTRAWKGGIVEPGDGVAHIGPTGGNIFYATGYSGNGMTYAAIAAQAFADFAQGGSGESPFPADRPLEMKSYLPKAKEYIEEFIEGAVGHVLKRKPPR